MPRRKRTNGKYVDIIAPLNNQTRQLIEEKVFAEYEKITGEPVTRRKLKGGLMAYVAFLVTFISLSAWDL